jgi:hypothetical protein
MAKVPSDADVLAALRGLRPAAEAGAPVAIRRRESEYRTSFPLEQIELEFEDGEELRLAFKRLDWSGLDAQGRLAKPRFLHDPCREPAVYAELLEPAALGTPRLYGSVRAAEQERHWLFVEWVEGRELYQVGERPLWEAAAGWLAALHGKLGGERQRHRAARLVDHDAGFYRLWIERAREFSRADGGSGPAAVAWLDQRHEAVVEALLALPRTAIHGEFYAANVLVAGDSAAPRVAPVDWELAALGPGVTDLAALVAGGWSDADRAAIVAAYEASGGSAAGLDFARLQLAIQWLGWAPPEWEPPPGQRHDWIGEAVALAEGLGL